jgi:hypothetical protein
LRDVEFLQEALNILVEMFKHVGLAANTKEMQAMVCTPGKIRMQPCWTCTSICARG